MVLPDGQVQNIYVNADSQATLSSQNPLASIQQMVDKAKQEVGVTHQVISCLSFIIHQDVQ